jgi:hypothetical protein
MTSRIVDLIDGTVMVVTDLHGAWSVYEQLRDQFLKLRGRGEADVLVFCGDLVHADDDNIPDRSVDILVDVMRLQRELGSGHVVMLLGNHELPHIHGITLAKGEQQYTPAFEKALARLGSQQRQSVIDFLAELPFYARSRGGVLLSHAGASMAIANVEALKRLLALDHRALLEEASRQLVAFGVETARQEYERLTGVSYARQANTFLAVSHPSDPRYDDLLRGYVISNAHPDFALLWQALFTRNEYDRSRGLYAQVVKNFLDAASVLSPTEQRVLVAGHIGTDGGYKLVGSRQLRLATYSHANPRSSGRYLLFDSRREIDSAGDLVVGLRPTFD